MIQETIIEPGSMRRHYVRQLIEARDLIMLLAWRDLIVRYRQTAAGITLVLFKPSIAIAVFSIVFGHIARLPSGGVPYPLLVMAGIVPWQLFANIFTECSTSITNNAGLVTKVRFPRLALPLACVLANLVDHGVTIVVVAIGMALFGWSPGWEIFLLPLAALMAVITSLGAGVWVAALMVRYRDFRNIVPFALQAALLLSPIAFSSSIVPERWSEWYALNPLVAPVECFRWALLGESFAPSWQLVGTSAICSLCLLISGLWFFINREPSFADVI